jgi:hypothetical protein
MIENLIQLGKSFGFVSSQRLPLKVNLDFTIDSGFNL